MPFPFPLRSNLWGKTPDMKSDIEIARSVELKKIKQVAESIGIPRDEVENYGRYIAKIPEMCIRDRLCIQFTADVCPPLIRCPSSGLYCITFPVRT